LPLEIFHGIERPHRQKAPDTLTARAPNERRSSESAAVNSSVSYATEAAWQPLTF